MGQKNTKNSGINGNRDNGNAPPEVSFDDFEVLRAIGRGAFGKVCLIEQKSTKKVLAMKYVNKEACVEQRAVQNVIEEVELLREVDHPFVVSLWYTFQDAEDLFIVLEPLLGGDIRYHLSGSYKFSEEAIRFICAEIGSALDFLRTKRIIHRDVKPDNILLDEHGHAHLTDFNVATKLKLNDEKPLMAMAGTKPYMAPEVFHAAAKTTRGLSGYSYPVDWWSLGITAFELKSGYRPYEIHSRTSLSTVISLFSTPQEEQESIYSSKWSPEFTIFLKSLLCVRPEKRIASLAAMKATKLMANVNLLSLQAKKLPPPFVPQGDGLNCDPTYELEEMIVETRPLHKKKKRLLLRQQSLLTQSTLDGPTDASGQNKQVNELEDNIFQDFPTYNREWERYKASQNEKEDQWESELNALMEKSADLKESTDNSTSKTEEKQSFHGALSPSKRLESRLETSKNEESSSTPNSKHSDRLSTLPSVASFDSPNREMKPDYQNVPSPTSSRSNQTKSCSYKRLRMRSKCGSTQRENSHSSDLEVICEKTPT